MRSKSRPFVVLSILLFSTLMAACAATPPKPAAETDWHFHAIVDQAFVRQHITVPMPEDVMLIDARPKRPKYDMGHIPMAISIPDSDFEKFKDQLPKNKNALLIYYCEGLTCKLSHQSARKAEALGYTNVKVYATGYPDWMQTKGNYAAVSAEWIKAQIDSKAEMVLVDSRPKQTKYDQGHIPTAISLPDTQFDKFRDQLPTDKNKLLVFYCDGYKCVLSHKSAAKAVALGYTNVKVFPAGYPAWQEVAGRENSVASGTSPLKAGKQEGSIDHGLFRQMLSEKSQGMLLVDVRDKEEFATGTLKNAVNIPVGDLEAKIITLPTDKPIVFFCGTGARSGESYYMVKDLRPELKNVYYLDGQLTMRKDGTFDLKESI